MLIAQSTMFKWCFSIPGQWGQFCKSCSFWGTRSLRIMSCFFCWHENV